MDDSSPAEEIADSPSADEMNDSLSFEEIKDSTPAEEKYKEYEEEIDTSDEEVGIISYLI